MENPKTTPALSRKEGRVRQRAGADSRNRTYNPMLTKHPLCLLSYVGIYQNPDSFFKLPGSIFCKILKAESKPHRIFALPLWGKLFRGGEVSPKFAEFRARSQDPPYPRCHIRTYAHAHKRKKRRKKAPWAYRAARALHDNLPFYVCVYMRRAAHGHGHGHGCGCGCGRWRFDALSKGICCAAYIICAYVGSSACSTARIILQTDQACRYQAGHQPGEQRSPGDLLPLHWLRIGSGWNWRHSAPESRCPRRCQAA